MEKIGVGLEKISLSALIISLGILVDNSIVITEGFLKRLATLKNKTQKAMNAISFSVTNEFFYSEIDRFTRREADTMTACSRNPDFKEAVYAFLEKRPAEFNKK